MANDRESVVADIEKWLEQRTVPALDHVEKRIQEAVDRNQNGPPQGEGDGSFDERAWSAAKRAAVALEDLRAEEKAARDAMEDALADLTHPRFRRGGRS